MPMHESCFSKQRHGVHPTSVPMRQDPGTIGREKRGLTDLTLTSTTLGNVIP